MLWMRMIFGSVKQISALPGYETIQKQAGSV
jgi:hypothetical protein